MLHSVLLLCGVALAVAAPPTPASCNGKPNLLPISTDEPVLLRTVRNGKLFRAGAADLDPPLQVAHVYGTPYEMGFAHGALLKEEINELYPQFFNYVYNEVDHYIDKLPKWLRDIIEKDGIYLALEATYLLTQPYIPQYFIDEVNGLAAGAGLDAGEVMRVALFPELIQASCSMMGSWGASIVNTSGSLFQLRALDWDTTSPMQQYPVVMVYHPSEGYGHAFSQLGWVGFVGALTGYSSAPVGVCEKVWISYPGKQNRAGQPWTFVLRDILQFDSDVESAVSRILNAKRTCSIWVGLGQAHTAAGTANATFRTVQYSYEEVNVYNDHNFPNHTQFKDLVYVDKHVQPSHDPCMPALIQQFYGNLDALNTIHYITAQFQTGDMHIAVFDFESQLAYFANASPYVNGTVTKAYDRPFTRLDMAKAFAEPAPSL